MKESIRPLYPSASVRELDRQAIAAHGIAGYTLMQRAGEAVFETICERYPDRQQWLVCCGSGNNGGDGYLVARLARQAGYQVQVLAMRAPEELSGDAALAASAWLEQGGSVSYETSTLPPCDLIVDALLGTGLERPVSGAYAALIGLINNAAVPVVAVDIPSGISADTGTVMGCAVNAGLTISFIGRKQGLYTADGPDHAGDRLFNDLAVPPEIYQAVPHQGYLIHESKYLFKPRRLNTHKGHYGHLLVIGGAPGYSGAARLCGEAALRCGAGLVSIACHPQVASCLNSSCPELMVRGVDQVPELEELLDQATVIALGPGLGRQPWGRPLYQAVIDREVPLVLDADGLNLLAEEPIELPNAILTPHPGEAARLLGSDSRSVQEDRFLAVQQLVKRYQAVVVLKGCGSLVGAPGQATGVCVAGNPGMAAGGMGDVLTGVIGALLAQGADPLTAASSGVWLHASAADQAAASGGQRGLLASDLMPRLRSLVNPL